jgi:hypothetical protein
MPGLPDETEPQFRYSIAYRNGHSATAPSLKRTVNKINKKQHNGTQRNASRFFNRLKPLIAGEWELLIDLDRQSSRAQKGATGRTSSVIEGRVGRG